MGHLLTNEVLTLDDILKLQQKIVPELIVVLEKRYNILRTIYYNQPIGRRNLSISLQLGERGVRNEIEFLKNQNLIAVNMPGMSVTKEGEEIIDKLKDFIHEIKGLSQIEQKIKEALNIKKVIIVPGDLEDDQTVLDELGRSAGNYIKSKIEERDIIALTGGSTIKAVIDNMPKLTNYKELLILPARGGMGKDVERQANFLTAQLAQKLNGSYKLLHIPENISDEKLIHKMLNEKSIKEVIDLLRKTNILIYGIGRADEMAVRRGLNEEEVSNILENGAVGEAFGHFFNRNGSIMYTSPSIGFKKEEIQRIPTLIAVAGSKNKAEAIISALINSKNSVLITDEGAAKEILNIIYNK